MYRLVPITLEEYRVLFDAGVWVYGSMCYGPECRGHEVEHMLESYSDADNPDWKQENWSYCYTRVEQEQP